MKRSQNNFTESESDSDSDGAIQQPQNPPNKKMKIKLDPTKVINDLTAAVADFDLLTTRYTMQASLSLEFF